MPHFGDEIRQAQDLSTQQQQQNYYVPSMNSKVGLEIGNRVPDFTLRDVDGMEHNLSDYVGYKVMLCFYRHSYCPVTAMTFGKLMGNYKKLAWATKLKVRFFWCDWLLWLSNYVCYKYILL